MRQRCLRRKVQLYALVVVLAADNVEQSNVWLERVNLSLTLKAELWSYQFRLLVPVLGIIPFHFRLVRLHASSAAPIIQADPGGETPAHILSIYVNYYM
jgi:hypothetical protein